MTPDEFRETVLPELVAAWDERCLCASRAFRKLISFNCRDYDGGPVGLADSEIVIEAIIRERFTKQGQLESEQGTIRTQYTCPQCGEKCTELFEDFSISMYQCVVDYEGKPALARIGRYLVGFYGFKSDDFEQVHDFRRAESVSKFVREMLIR